jgi:hypothetical protein
VSVRASGLGRSCVSSDLDSVEQNGRKDTAQAKAWTPNGGYDNTRKDTAQAKAWTPNEGYDNTRKDTAQAKAWTPNEGTQRLVNA